MGDAKVNRDLKGLKELYNKDKAAKAILENLAGQSVSLKETSVEWIIQKIAMDGRVLTRPEIVGFFQTLNKLGFGQFVPGRRGQQSRFTWNARMVSVGRFVIGEATDIEDSQQDDKQEAVEESLTHNFQLRRNLAVMFSLPVNLTAAEAQRLADFIKTLPFEPDSRS